MSCLFSLSFKRKAERHSPEVEHVYTQGPMFNLQHWKKNKTTFLICIFSFSRTLEKKKEKKIKRKNHWPPYELEHSSDITHPGSTRVRIQPYLYLAFGKLDISITEYENIHVEEMWGSEPRVYVGAMYASQKGAFLSFEQQTGTGLVRSEPQSTD